MEAVGLVPDHVLPAGDLPVPLDSNDPQLHRTARATANENAAARKRLHRLGMAITGDLLIIVPMLIMANVPGRTASLISTSVAMLIFATLVTWFTELQPNEVPTSTAAYAAVLVVFVGTSLAPAP